MNTIYQKTKKSQRKVKDFNNGEIEKAMFFGWELSSKNQQNQYFIITENGKCLKFNLTIIV